MILFMRNILRNFPSKNIDTILFYGNSEFINETKIKTQPATEAYIWILQISSTWISNFYYIAFIYCFFFTFRFHSVIFCLTFLPFWIWHYFQRVLLFSRDLCFPFECTSFYKYQLGHNILLFYRLKPIISGLLSVYNNICLLETYNFNN